MSRATLCLASRLAALAAASLRRSPWLALALVAMCFAAGCSGADDGTDATETDDSELTTPAKALVLYAGPVMRGNDIDATLTARLFRPGVENVLVMAPRPAPGGGILPPHSVVPFWKGAVAFHMPRKGEAPNENRSDALEHNLAAGSPSREADRAAIDATKAYMTTELNRGFDYIAIDELNDFLNPGAGAAAVANTPWRNGGYLARRFAALVKEMPGKIILYVNSYNMKGELSHFKQVLSACATSCRMIASEIYIHQSCTQRDAPVKAGNGKVACENNMSTFEELALEMRAVRGGINLRTITVLGVSDEYTENADGLCGPNGGLALQYAKLRGSDGTRSQPGIGAYTPARMDARKEAAVACISRLNAAQF